MWTSEEISKHHDEYWQIVFDIATHMTLTRIERCGQIMGRRSKKSSAAAATAGEKKEPQRKATDKKQVKDKTSAPASGDKTENKDSQPVDDDDDDDDEVPDWLGEFCKEVREGKFRRVIGDCLIFICIHRLVAAGKMPCEPSCVADSWTPRKPKKAAD